ncbi:MAG: hypothetical protein K5768_02475 [Firmicutes bacterium]|nr:hypothetical protein [Bacillota bacterium]
MKIIFLSVTAFIYGYFCDICLDVCEKSVKRRLEKGKPLTGVGLTFISNLTNNSFLRWQRIEKRLIYLLVSQRNF